VRNQTGRLSGIVAIAEIIHGLMTMVGQKISGAPGRDRTADLRFTKPLLYQLSYKGTALR
jgi:hypothetical protein